MRTADLDILIIPGLNGSGPDHWQSRWEAKLSTARRVAQDDWDRPILDAWTARIMTAAEATARPCVLIAHSLGVIAAVHAAPRLPARVIGAFLVAPAGAAALAEIPEIDPAFTPIPRDPLPFPSALIASTDDPYCDFATAEDLGFAWGSSVANAGAAGHINSSSGHGPWPEGLMRLAGFLKQLG